MTSAEKINKDDYVVFDNGATVKVSHVDLRYVYNFRLDFYKRENLGYGKRMCIWLKRRDLGNEHVKIVKVLHGDSEQG